MVKIDSYSWYELLVKLHKDTGNPSFYSTLTATLKEVIEFDCSGVFLYSSDEASCLYQQGSSENYKMYIGLYLKGLYQLDPHYNLIAKGASEGLYRFKDIAPDCYHDTEYFQRFVKPTGITDEYDFIIKADNGYIDFYLDLLGGDFSTDDEDTLKTISPIITHYLKEHIEKTNNQAKNIEEIIPESEVTNPERKTYASIFDSFGKTILTKREQEVLQCIMYGHSSKSLAIKLNIAPGTVKIHRKNIYQKLEISSQAELFSLCIQSLSINDLNEHEDPLAALTKSFKQSV